MSEEFEIESFEYLIDVFENTGDFGKYYLGDYSNIQIANYLRKMQQENKQLKEDKQKVIEFIKKEYLSWFDDFERPLLMTDKEDWEKILEILEGDKENE